MLKKIKQNRIVLRLYALYLRIFGGGNRFRGTKRNSVAIDGIYRHTELDLHGTGNTIAVRNPKYVNRFHIFINGSNNRIEIDENCLIKDLTLWIEDDNNRIYIGRDTLFCGTCQLSCIESTEITIGKGCLFSGGIRVRTGDSHSILDVAGKRINPSQNVYIGNHVWVGQNVTILKGASVGDNSVCGTGAIVTKKFTEAGVILAGTPAKIVKENINWCFERIQLK